MSRTLLVIDVQDSFRQSDRWPAMANPDIAIPVGRLVEAFRASGEPVVWVLHADPGSGGAFDPDQGLVRPLAPLQPRADEPVLVKITINAFTSTDLQSRLQASGTDEVVICGIRTEQCCETTARVAGDLGFNVTFVLEATTTSAIGELSAEQIIERTAVVLAGRGFATIAGVDAVIGSGVLAG